MAIKTVWPVTCTCGHIENRDLSDKRAGKRAASAKPNTDGLGVVRCDDTQDPHSTNSLGVIVHHWRGTTTDNGVTYPDYRTWSDDASAATDTEDVHA